MSGRIGTMSGCLSALDVLVLAGGLGSRIRPVLGETPKLLAPIEGRPFLALLLDWLRGFGARRVVLSLGYQSAKVLDYLTAHPTTNIEIATCVESTPLGTAGAVRLARSLLRSDPVMIMNGDSLVTANLCALVERQREARALGTILCTEVADGSRYGRVILVDQSRVKRFAEKDDSHRGSSTISAGVYALSARLLDQISASDARSLERDIFQKLPQGALAALVGRFRFIDIGTPESLSQAASFLREERIVGL